MKISVSGKGGVGKTLVAGILARLFAKDDFKVLAIDNDSAMNLSYTLGIDEKTKGQIVPIKEMKSMIEERTNVNGAGSGVYNINPEVSDIPDKFKVSGKDGLQLLVLGGIEEPASGCLCPENALIRTLLYNLLVKRDEWGEVKNTVNTSDLMEYLEDKGKDEIDSADINIYNLYFILKSLNASFA